MSGCRPIRRWPSLALDHDAPAYGERAPTVTSPTADSDQTARATAAATRGTITRRYATPAGSTAGKARIHGCWLRRIHLQSGEVSVSLIEQHVRFIRRHHGRHPQHRRPSPRVPAVAQCARRHEVVRGQCGGIEIVDSLLIETSRNRHPERRRGSGEERPSAQCTRFSRTARAKVSAAWTTQRPGPVHRLPHRKAPPPSNGGYRSRTIR